MSTLNITPGSAQLIDEPAGSMEVFVDLPKAGACRGIAIVGYPQPLLGGSAVHKIPHFLARTLSETGW